ncbi:MAG: glycerophosphodiester phosphodiesterase [Clostridia bacterium]|nr:glycerophosphodiester phosphodiesterase [Clostridia bacterium]
MIILLYISIAIAIILALYVASAMTYVGKKRRRKFADSPLICPYAHRGLHGNGVPENSLAAFGKAVDAGHGIELDLQLSSDGEVMVFHDYTLVRMTGEGGLLSEKTAEELSTLRLAGTDEHIPTLREVLALVDGHVPLLIELKGESMNTALPPKADEILREYKGAYCIESFNPLLVSWYRKNRPDIMRGQLYTNFCSERKCTPLNVLLTALSFNFIARPDFVAFDHNHAGTLPLRLVRALCKPYRFTWTVRTEDGFEVARKYSANPIFEGELPQDFKK